MSTAVQLGPRGPSGGQGQGLLSGALTVTVLKYGERAADGADANSDDGTEGGVPHSKRVPAINHVTAEGEAEDQEAG